jgi:hypothetical protein
MTDRLRLDRKGVSLGVVAVVVLLIGVYLGSGALGWFDAALAPYLFGTLLAVFATIYRYVVWLRRPPTARLNQRGWEALKARGKLGSNLVALAGLLVSNIALQRFISNRSREPAGSILTRRHWVPLILLHLGGLALAIGWDGIAVTSVGLWVLDMLLRVVTLMRSRHDAPKAAG